MIGAAAIAPELPPAKLAQMVVKIAGAPFLLGMDGAINHWSLYPYTSGLPIKTVPLKDAGIVIAAKVTTATTFIGVATGECVIPIIGNGVLAF